MNTFSSKTNIMDIQKAVTKKGTRMRSILFGRGGIGALRRVSSIYGNVGMQTCLKGFGTGLGRKGSVIVRRIVHLSVLRRPSMPCHNQYTLPYGNTGNTSSAGCIYTLEPLLHSLLSGFGLAQALTVLLHEESRIRRWAERFQLFKVKRRDFYYLWSPRRVDAISNNLQVVSLHPRLSIHHNIDACNVWRFDSTHGNWTCMSNGYTMFWPDPARSKLRINMK